MNVAYFTGAAVSAEDLLDDYLDHVCAPLVGRISYRERQARRASIREQAEKLASDAARSGASPPAAMRTSLRTLGPPGRLSSAAIANSRPSWRTARLDRVAGLLALVAVAGTAGFYVNHWMLFLFNCVQHTRYASGTPGDWMDGGAAVLTVLLVCSFRLGPIRGAIAGWLPSVAAWLGYGWFVIRPIMPRQLPPMTRVSLVSYVPGLSLHALGNILIGCVAGYLVMRAHRLAGAL